MLRSFLKFISPSLKEVWGVKISQTYTSHCESGLHIYCCLYRVLDCLMLKIVQKVISELWWPVQTAIMFSVLCWVIKASYAYDVYKKF